MLGVPADLHLLADFPLLFGPHPVGGLLEGNKATSVAELQGQLVSDPEVDVYKRQQVRRE